MSQGYVYAFWHECAPANTPTTVRIKIGRSERHPWGPRHELRGEKLAFGFDTFGFNRQSDVFAPILVNDQKAAERIPACGELADVEQACAGPGGPASGGFV